jgi:hypothetical protein
VKVAAKQLGESNAKAAAPTIELRLRTKDGHMNVQLIGEKATRYYQDCVCLEEGKYLTYLGERILAFRRNDGFWKDLP